MCKLNFATTFGGSRKGAHNFNSSLAPVRHALRSRSRAPMPPVFLTVVAVSPFRCCTAY
jgi:hypothetical protein